MAEKYNLPVLQKNAPSFIHNPIVEVFDQNEILEYPFSELETFFREKQCLFPQHVLLSFICKWVDHNVSKRESDLRTLLTFINWNSIERPYLDDHLKTCNLCRKNPKCMYLLLTCLEENKIDLLEFQSVYESLKCQYGPGGSNVDNDSFMNIAISAAIHGPQKYPTPNNSEENTPITVAPLEKDQVKEKVSAPPPEEPGKLSSDNEETRNSSFKNAVSDCSIVIDYDDDSQSSEDEKEKSLATPTNNKGKIFPQKLKFKTSHRNTVTTRRSTQIQTTIAPIKKPRKTICCISATAATVKNSHKVQNLNIKTSKTLSTSNQGRVVSNRGGKAVIKPTNRLYVSESYSNDYDFNDDDEDEGKLFISESSVKESVDGHSNKSNWKNGVKCPDCCYIANCSARLQKHVSRIHAKNVTYKCKVCDFTCKWNREYYLHMKTHFQGPPFRCEKCEYTCNRIQYLLSHHAIHTDERPFKCDECSHRCRTKANLDCHMRHHTGEKPYQCEYCERRFALKSCLNKHLASHSEDRPFLCDTCGFSTKYQWHLFSHMRMHTGEVFHCPFPNCEYSTPNKSQLGTHHRTHTAVRSHICSICGRAFGEKSHLVRHERIHLEEKPFKCEHCDYGSSRRDKLKEHFRKYHGENATAKGPYRPRKQRRQSNDLNVNSLPNNEGTLSETEIQLPPQHIELQTAVSAIGTNNPLQPPVVYSFETPQETLDSHVVTVVETRVIILTQHLYLFDEI
ncbi:kelch-like protein 17 [Nephila pilipes]|uniref:Kelch-like protein 17 n=1 Tax=Nephila pilipes TaxID=299642 RepID=A0A8X6QRM4_NEPPI|nr:kelch-like protein 17 [Nephila pilipes]